MAASASYSRLQIGLHWLIALMILTMILTLWLIEAKSIQIPLGLVMFAALGLRSGHLAPIDHTRRHDGADSVSGAIRSAKPFRAGPRIF